MAKKKRAIQQVADEKLELQMTPMIDVTFLLLIFFMCTLKFKVLEGKLGANLPKDVGVMKTEAEEIETVDVRIDVIREGTKLLPQRGGTYTNYDPIADAGKRYEFADDREVVYKMSGDTLRDLGVIEKRLKEIKDLDEEAKATVDAREKVTYKEVVQLLDAMINAGYDDVTFKGSYEE